MAHSLVLWKNSEEKGKRNHQPKKDWKLFPVELSDCTGRFWAFFIWMWTHIMLVVVDFLCGYFGSLPGAKSKYVKSKIDSDIQWFEYLKSWVKQATIHINECSRCIGSQQPLSTLFGHPFAQRLHLSEDKSMSSLTLICRQINSREGGTLLQASSPCTLLQRSQHQMAWASLCHQP